MNDGKEASVRAKAAVAVALALLAITPTVPEPPTRLEGEVRDGWTWTNKCCPEHPKGYWFRYKPQVQEVPVLRPFRSGPIRHGSHNCPQCGRPQFAVSGRGPQPGTHTHTCSRCGTTWFHH